MELRAGVALLSLVALHGCGGTGQEVDGAGVFEVVVSPSATTIALGEETEFCAVAFGEGGEESGSVIVDVRYLWSVERLEVATSTVSPFPDPTTCISLAELIVTGIATGTTTVSATAGSVVGRATLTVR